MACCSRARGAAAAAHSAFHAVLVGATRGVFASVEDAAAAAGDVPLPLIEAYKTREDAAAAVWQFKDVCPERVVYVDGSSLRNGKPDAVAGFGVFYGDGDARNVSACVRRQPHTNNVAELEGIQCALEHERAAAAPSLAAAAAAAQLMIVTDSSYAIKCTGAYFDAWERNGWVTALKAPVKNAELIRSVRALLDALPHVRLFHVHGHAGIVGNERADALATAATAAAKKEADFALGVLAAAASSAVALPAQTTLPNDVSPGPSALPATGGAVSERRPTRKRKAPVK